MVPTLAALLLVFLILVVLGFPQQRALRIVANVALLLVILWLFLLVAGSLIRILLVVLLVVFIVRLLKR